MKDRLIMRPLPRGKIRIFDRPAPSPSMGIFGIRRGVTVKVYGDDTTSENGDARREGGVPAEIRGPSIADLIGPL